MRAVDGKQEINLEWPYLGVPEKDLGSPIALAQERGWLCKTRP